MNFSGLSVTMKKKGRRRNHLKAFLKNPFLLQPFVFRVFFAAAACLCLGSSDLRKQVSA
jgi:hypothetical protein